MMSSSRANPGDDRPNDASSSSAGGEDMAVVDFLQKAGQQYREHLALLVQQRRQEEQATMRSVPVISPHASSMRRTGAAEQRLFNLWEKRNAALEAQREEVKKQREQKEVKEVKPRPKITDRAKSLQHRKTQAEITEQFLREKEEKLVRYRDQKLEKELEEVMDKPQVLPYHSGNTQHHNTSQMVRNASQYHTQYHNTTTTTGGNGGGVHNTTAASTTSAAAAAAARRGGKPIEEHLLSQERKRQESLRKSVDQELDRYGKKNVPKISEHAQSIQREGDVTSRLSEPKRPVAYDKEMEEDCTFAPRINSKYEDPLQELPTYVRVSERPVLHRSRYEWSNESTGTPRISQHSLILAENTRQRNAVEHGISVNLSPGSRLYVEGQMKLEGEVRKQEEARRAHDEAFAFRPTISRKSQEMLKGRLEKMRKIEGNEHMSSREMMDLIWKRRVQKRDENISNVKKERDAKELEECKKRPQHVDSNKNKRRPQETKKQFAQDFVTRNEQWMLQREGNLVEHRMEKEQSELSGCTFTPCVHQEIPVPVATTVPEGVESHIYRMREGRKLKVDAEEKANHIGMRGASSSSSQPSTPVKATGTPKRADGRAAAAAAAATPSSFTGGGGGPRARRTVPTAFNFDHTNTQISSLRPPVRRHEVQPFFADQEGDEYYYEDDTAATTTAAAAAASYGYAQRASGVDHLLSSHHSIAHSLSGQHM